jgi:protein-L-isoaspartate(D-aspartate) O-methyltransferase
MNIEHARHNMIEQQIRPWNVFDADVLDVIKLIKRERFVPTAYQALALADTEIPLGATSSARMLPPALEARALQALAMKPHERVLEIGAGSGYMAALLGAHADHVWSVEINPQLAETARANLQRSGVTNVTVINGNGLDGVEEFAPFDAIMISGAVDAVPEKLTAQLKPGGRLFAFVGKAPAMRARLIARRGDTFVTSDLFETVVETLVDPAAKASFTF